MLLGFDKLSVRQCDSPEIVPEKHIGIFRQCAGSGGTYALIVNQMESNTMTNTIAPQTTGVTFFVLPLRGESFGA
jgi:hypothetical protein